MRTQCCMTRVSVACLWSVFNTDRFPDNRRLCPVLPFPLHLPFYRPPPSTTPTTTHTLSSKQNGKADGQSTHDTDDTVICEISPLISYAGEGLEELKGVKLCPPVILELSPDSKLDIRQGSQ
ncbi:hypothetical protein V1264_002576 [Littorina saxatilis]|uniref:Uncharacterized protein n=1 Tax=Littorina saxatilis TaxID=31220 RepID=A0AAN9B2X9_9CAEN